MMKKKNETMKLMCFDNAEFGEVRLTVLGDTPWFVGKDIAAGLGYSNPQKAIRDHVDQEDKTMNEKFTVNGTRMIFINECGMYSLIFSSKLPTAKRFKHWIMSEVLPAVRNRDSNTLDNAANVLDLVVKAAQSLKPSVEDQKNLPVTTASMDYCDYVKMFTDDQPITVIAKDYGWTARKMNSFLQDRGIQHKAPKGNAWLITPEYAGKGLAVTTVYTCPSYSATSTKWTTAGRLFIYDLMKQAGYKPIMEQ